MNPITLICLSIIVFYCFSQIMNFYGIKMETYAVYFCFYAFLLICIFIIPKKE